MNCDAPIVPYEYHKTFDLKNYSNQSKIGNPEFLHWNDTEYFGVKASYTKLSSPQHINLYKNKFL